MKVKSKTVYLVAALLFALALYLLIQAASPGLVSTYQPDVSRFGPDSVDVQMANGDLRRDPPYMVTPPPVKPLLLFPPSEEDLKKLSGPPTSV